MAYKLKNRLLILLTEKERKEERRIKQLEVANAVGISSNTVASWIRNDVTKFEAHVVEGLCQYFECGLCDLLYFAESNEGTASPYGAEE